MEELGGKILTVVIPAYNMENYISKCCSSLVIDNNFGALEVLIINDGSTDMTSEIAHGFAKDYPEVFRVIDKENGNYGSCVNRGLGEARGVFIKILDGDDSFNNNEFEGYVRFLIDVERKFLDKVDLIITDRCIVDGDGVIKEQKSYDFSGEKIYDINKISCLKGAGITQHSVTYRTKKLVDMGYEAHYCQWKILFIILIVFICIWLDEQDRRLNQKHGWTISGCRLLLKSIYLGFMSKRKIYILRKIKCS